MEKKRDSDTTPHLFAYLLVSFVCLFVAFALHEEAMFETDYPSHQISARTQLCPRCHRSTHHIPTCHPYKQNTNVGLKLKNAAKLSNEGVIGTNTHVSLFVQAYVSCFMFLKVFKCPKIKLACKNGPYLLI